MKAVTPEALQLFHEGARALSRVEANGIRIDRKYIRKTMKKVDEDVIRLQSDLKEDPISQTWKRRYGAKTNFGSRDQLASILFKELKLKCSKRTASGKPSTDETVLTELKNPYVDKYLHLEKMKKARSTYLRGILRQTDIHGFIHPFFNLNTVVTYRSSSDSPNFQNMPIRNPLFAEMIRRCFIPRKPGNHIVEIDYGGIEVKVSACYNLDPTLINYIKDPKSDMHRDMGMQCFKLTADQMTKMIRYVGKNRFVFPEFYGNYYINCAQDLWNAIPELNLVRADGTPLLDHLRSKGIRRLGKCDPELKAGKGTFERHIQEVEKDFWERRFRVYNQWRKDWYEDYKERGYFDTHTGFRLQGNFKRNEVINYPVQGSAFHCLLWTLNRLVLRELHRYGFKSLIIGQIHDSIVADVPHNELEDFCELVHEVMITQLRKHWKWIVVPMEVDFEVTPKGKSWYEKEEYKL